MLAARMLVIQVVKACMHLVWCMATVKVVCFVIYVAFLFTLCGKLKRSNGGELPYYFALARCLVGNPIRKVKKAPALTVG